MEVEDTEGAMLEADGERVIMREVVSKERPGGHCERRDGLDGDVTRVTRTSVSVNNKGQGGGA